MRRKQPLSIHVRAAEKAAITQFMLDEAVPTEPENRLPIRHVFDAYNAWRVRNKLPSSQLSTDGFGRLFPKAYARKSLPYPMVNGTNHQCVLGMTLKNPKGGR